LILSNWSNFRSVLCNYNLSDRQEILNNTCSFQKPYVSINIHLHKDSSNDDGDVAK
jgi:hypothetical protein